MGAMVSNLKKFPPKNDPNNPLLYLQSISMYILSLPPAPNGHTGSAGPLITTAYTVNHTIEFAWTLPGVTDINGNTFYRNIFLLQNY